jgi:hypothetical protein
MDQVVRAESIAGRQIAVVGIASRRMVVVDLLKLTRKLTYDER